MLEQTVEILERAGAFISLFAAALIIIGFILTAVNYVLKFRKLGPVNDFTQFKRQLGKILTLGLEILVLSDVLETILVPPTYQSLAVLAFLLIVRIFVSWTLSLEIEGRWPWQTKTEEAHV